MKTGSGGASLRANTATFVFGTPRTRSLKKSRFKTRPRQKRGSRPRGASVGFLFTPPTLPPCRRKVSEAKTRRGLVFADAPDENGERRSEHASEHRDPRFRAVGNPLFEKEQVQDASAPKKRLPKAGASFLVRAKGLEPSQPCDHKNLNLTRLPIPPRPRRIWVSSET